MQAKKLLLAAAVLTAVPVWAASTSKRPATPDPLRLTPQEFVDARQAGMHLGAADIQLIRTAGEKGADIRRLSGAATALSKWAAVVPTLFPAGTGPDAVETDALPEVWSNRADFEKRAQDFATASASLAQSLSDGDFAASRERWDTTWESCNACHARYRKQTPPTR